MVSHLLYPVSMDCVLADDYPNLVLCLNQSYPVENFRQCDIHFHIEVLPFLLNKRL